MKCTPMKCFEVVPVSSMVMFYSLGHFVAPQECLIWPFSFFSTLEAFGMLCMLKSADALIYWYVSCASYEQHIFRLFKIN